MTARKNTAVISRCGSYRYALWRTWDPARGAVMFIGLNPSTADATTDDPTLRRCMRFARDWGYGGVIMANLFAFRATQPSDLLEAARPVGPRNNRWLRQLADDAALMVAAWGNDGAHRGRAAAVCNMLPSLACLKVNGSGEPGHPLYIRATAKPIAYERPSRSRRPSTESRQTVSAAKHFAAPPSTP
ncbi:MAG: DUF1643 domain-containing protein [Pseudomonadota bacterium]